MDIANELLIDAFERIKDVVLETIYGLDVDELAFRPTEKANSIAWLVWHLTRIQDDHISDLAGKEQVWAEVWHKKFGLPFGESDTGYGHSSQDVAAVRPSAQQLAGYLDAVCSETVKYVKKLGAHDYQRVVDKRWDPPVTMAVRLISIISDDLQHAGQAAYIRGLLRKRS
ncbi:MAG TPA: DUF664 domain-containing protein [Candidatus Saccharimonadales bacterium]|jgi:hypothetical protein